MKTWAVVLLVILAILIVAVVVLYFLGRKMQKKQEEQQQQIEAYKQNVTMLVIDKKIMKLKEAGLPQSVIDNTPKMMRRSKLPIVKAKSRSADRYLSLRPEDFRPGSCEKKKSRQPSAAST